jgi:choline dehydrogenase-like flavoprotein
LGGSSAINFMMASHPSAVDIDAWGRLGNIGWDWATLMPYYQRSETLQLDNTHAASSAGSLFDRSLYGADGPVQLSLLPESDDEKTAGVAWRNAMASLGLDAKDDPRRGSTTGAYAVARFVDSANGWVRSYAAKAYYEPVRDERKDRLVIRTRAHVTRILLDDQELMSPSGEKTKTASAVEFEFEGKRYTVKAEKEIILSAGTFQSPQILELSGIGHPDILEGAGIKPLVENPYVGENLQVRKESRVYKHGFSS